VSGSKVNTDFVSAKVDWDRRELVVTGETTRGGGTVSLVPQKHSTVPDYWQVDLVWDKENAIYTSMTPFEARLPLASAAGIKGVLLKGKSKTLTIETSK